MSIALNLSIQPLAKITKLVQQTSIHPQAKYLFLRELELASSHIKQYQQIITQNKKMFAELEQEIYKLGKQKDRLLHKHQEVIESIEMLLFQKNYDALMQKVSKFKTKSLDSSIQSFKGEMSQNYEGLVKLNEAFVFEQSNEDQKVQQALRIINSDEAFEKKEQIWLDIVQNNNHETEESDLHHITVQEIEDTRRKIQNISEFTVNNLTEISQIHHSKMEETKNKQFLGKKIKSMVILKQKSNKKNTPKTSVKKREGKQKGWQNQQALDIQVGRKKLNFASHQKAERQGNRSKIKKTESKPKTGRKTIVNFV